MISLISRFAAASEIANVALSRWDKEPNLPAKNRITDPEPRAFWIVSRSFSLYALSLGDFSFLILLAPSASRPRNNIAYAVIQRKP
tara:strand:- start:394 stop:651 length:258 start_codon:yes stop_codon:yes gene_type:complete